MRWIRLSRASKEFGRSYQYLYVLVREGAVPSAFSREGRIVVDADALGEVLSERQERAGGRRKEPEGSGLSAAVFEGFKRGDGLREIVLATKASPAYVRQLWKEWNTPLESEGEMATRKVIEKVEEDERREKHYAHQERLALLRGGGGEKKEEVSYQPLDCGFPALPKIGERK